MNHNTQIYDIVRWIKKKSVIYLFFIPYKHFAVQTEKAGNNKSVDIFMNGFIKYL
jgi:hypothetical protein